MTNKKENPFIKYPEVLLKVLLFYNILELIGSFIVNGDWGYIVLANIVFLVMYLWLSKIRERRKC